MKQRGERFGTAGQVARRSDRFGRAARMLVAICVVTVSGEVSAQGHSPPPGLATTLVPTVGSPTRAGSVPAPVTLERAASVSAGGVTDAAGAQTRIDSTASATDALAARYRDALVRGQQGQRLCPRTHRPGRQPAPDDRRPEGPAGRLRYHRAPALAAGAKDGRYARSLRRGRRPFPATGTPGATGQPEAVSGGAETKPRREIRSGRRGLPDRTGLWPHPRYRGARWSTAAMPTCCA